MVKEKSITITLIPLTAPIIMGGRDWGGGRGGREKGVGKVASISLEPRKGCPMRPSQLFYRE